MKYVITWWTDMGNDQTATTLSARTFDAALALLPKDGAYERYRITQGKRFVERGDRYGPRGAPAKERRTPFPVVIIHEGE